MKKRNIQFLMLFLFSLFTGSILAQIEVTGIVSNSLSENLPGVTVLEVGTTNGTVTDFDGNYSIIVSNSEAVLEFTYVGMKTKDITVGNQTILNVILEESAEALDEVVVTALGISREKKSLGYAIDEVNSEEIALGATANFLKNLDGKVTGVAITSLSSDPTSSTFVVIRGATSIAGVSGRNSSATAQPLYVIDGVAVGSGGVQTFNEVDGGNFMSEISPDDIESVTILKGASAAALYGSEGGNGVVVITTKSGSGLSKGIGVSVNSSFTMDNVYKVLPLQNSYVSGEDVFYDPYEKSTNGPHYSELTGDYLQWDMISQEFVNKPITRTTENRLEEFFQTGSTLTNNVAVVGNYKKGNFRMSYTNMINEGVIPSAQTKRNNVAFSAGYNVTDKLKVSGNAQYINTYTPNKPVVAGRHAGGEKYNTVMYSLYTISPDKQPISDWSNPWINGQEGIQQNTAYLRFRNHLGDDDELNRSNWEPNYSTNPYYAATAITNTYSRESFIGKAQLEWDIIESLKLTGRTGINSTTFHAQTRIPWNMHKKLQDGAFYASDSQNTRINTDIMLAYNEKFGEFSVNALVGYNYRITNNNYSSLGGKHLARPNDYSIGAINKDNLNTSYNWGTGKYSSVYTTASVGYKDMLYLDLSARKDWVGVSELQKNSSVYPGASLSWLVSESINKPDWMNMLKLRGGVAQVGYGIPTFLNVDNYGISGTWNGTTYGNVYGSVVNPDIKSELNTTYEGGIDAKLFNSRVNFEFTMFQKVHSNQIQDIPIVSSSGFSNYRTNIGTVTADGIELGLTVVPVRTEDWLWSLTGNFTKYEAKITELDPAFTEKWIGYESGTALRLKENELIGGLYAEEGFWRVQSGEYQGQIMLKQDTGTPIENDDPANRDYLGNYNPDFMLGLTTHLEYKAFSLDVVSTYRGGGVYVSQTALILRDDGHDPWSVSGDGFYWEGGRTHDGGFAWPDPSTVPAGPIRQYNEQNNYAQNASYWNGVYVDPATGADGQDRNLPDGSYILNGADPTTTWYASDEKVVGNTWDFPQTRTFDATFFKIRDIALTYDVSKELTSKIGMENASIALIARNVYLWTKSGRNEDPETAFSGAGTKQGVSYVTLPSVRQVGLKLNMNF